MNSSVDAAAAELRERYAALSAPERAVFDVVAGYVAQSARAPLARRVAALLNTRADDGELKRCVEYGQALLSVYRLVKRGIVPDPALVEYLREHLNPELASSLAAQQAVSSTSPSSGTGPAVAGAWSRALLAQKLMRDTNNKYNRLVSVAGAAEPGVAAAQTNFAVRLENLKFLHTILSRKFLKHSLRSPEQVYNFIISNDSVGTLSAIAHSVAEAERVSGAGAFAADAAALLDRKGDVLVKLAALMSEQRAKISKPQTPVAPLLPAGGAARVPLYVALSNFRKHKFPPGQLLLAKTVTLKDDIGEAGKLWLSHRMFKRHAYSAIANQASTRISSRELRRQQEAQREQRERMKALRERNMDAYMALVKNVKNQRIQEILENTEKLLQDIGAKIQVERVQNEERRRQDAARAAEKLRRREERKLARKQSKGVSTTSPTAVANDVPALPEEDDEEEEVAISSAVVEQPECLVGGKLMSYQLAGLDFLMSLYTNNLSGILADEMGLGKTIQTISLIAYLLEKKKNPGPHLIAVPLSTLPNWSSEFAKWCPTLKVLEYRGSKEERRELNYDVRRSGNYNVLLTTFEYILRERKVLGAIKWRFIIVDEGHKMKNVKSKFHNTLGEFKSTHRLLLTGTPLQNNLNELWSLLNFLMPHTFNSGEDFERWFEEPFKDKFATGGGNAASAAKSDNSNSMLSLTEEEKLIVINRLHLVLRPFLLRRIKADVVGDLLPSKIEHVVRIPLTAYQKILYEQIMNKSLKFKDSTSGKITSKGISNTIMQLRKVVNHPYLFSDMYNIDEDLFRTSGKFEVLDRVLPKLIAYKHKILIFSQMTSLMDILEDYLSLKKLNYLRLDGSMVLTDRQSIIQKFNSPDEDYGIFILSTRAGGLGLNLQSGDTVILFDSDWNPHADLQALARVHRVGQKRKVLVLRFITNSPIEEMILAKAQYKLNIDQQIIQAGMFSNQEYDEDLREKNLRDLLLSQKDIKFHSTLTDPLQLNHFIARSEEEEQNFNAIDEELLGDLRAWPKDKHVEMLQQTGRLCTQEEIPPHLLVIDEEADPLKDLVPGIRKSRLKAQQSFKSGAEYNSEDDYEEEELEALAGEEECAEAEEEEPEDEDSRRETSQRGDGEDANTSPPDSSDAIATSTKGIESKRTASRRIAAAPKAEEGAGTPVKNEEEQAGSSLRSKRRSVNNRIGKKRKIA